MSRALVAAGVIRAGRVTVARMAEPLVVAGTATEIAPGLAATPVGRGLSDVAFAEWVDAVARVAPAVVYADGSHRRA